MESSAIIESARNGATLKFSNRESDYFHITLAGTKLQGSISVYSYEPRGTDVVGFFRDLASHWDGWTGKKEWSSLEGEFQLSASMDSTGHVNLDIEMRSGHDDYAWSIKTTLLIEAGHLSQISSDIGRFFSAC
jgi:hypothetical protein